MQQTSTLKFRTLLTGRAAFPAIVAVRLMLEPFPEPGASVLAAAFIAAAEGRDQIDHATVVQAARGEYLSMGHMLAVSSGL